MARNKKRTYKKKTGLGLRFWALLFTALFLTIYAKNNVLEDDWISGVQDSIALSEIPEYSGEPFIVINDNEPEFTEEDFSEDSFETYSELDSLGRCGAAYANVGTDLMPTEKRGSIGQVKPSGCIPLTTKFCLFTV